MKELIILIIGFIIKDLYKGWFTASPAKMEKFQKKCRDADVTGKLKKTAMTICTGVLCAFALLMSAVAVSEPAKEYLSKVFANALPLTEAVYDASAKLLVISAICILLPTGIAYLIQGHSSRFMEMLRRLSTGMSRLCLALACALLISAFICILGTGTFEPLTNMLVMITSQITSYLCVAWIALSVAYICGTTYLCVHTIYELIKS